MIPVSGASNSFLIMTSTVCKCLTAKIVYQILKRNPKRKICSKQNYQEWTLLTLVHTIRFSDPIITQIQRH